MHKLNCSTLVLAVLLLAFIGRVNAQGGGNGAANENRQRGPVIELESRVTGNREQPQVFYLVPWQSPESPRPDYDPLSSQLQQVFGHLEREELKRELDQRAEPGSE